MSSTYLSIRKRLSRQRQHNEQQGDVNSDPATLRAHQDSNMPQPSKLDAEGTVLPAVSVGAVDHTAASGGKLTPVAVPSRSLSQSGDGKLPSNPSKPSNPPTKLSKNKDRSVSHSKVPVIKVAAPTSEGKSTHFRGESSDNNAIEESGARLVASVSASPSLSPASTKSAPSQTTVKHMGVDFEILNTSRSSNDLRSKMIPPRGIHLDEFRDLEKRITKAQSRREQRAHVEDLFRATSPATCAAKLATANNDDESEKTTGIAGRTRASEDDPQTTVLRDSSEASPSPSQTLDTEESFTSSKQESTPVHTNKICTFSGVTATPANSPTHPRPVSKERADSVQYESKPETKDFATEDNTQAQAHSTDATLIAPPPPPSSSSCSSQQQSRRSSTSSLRSVRSAKVTQPAPIPTPQEPPFAISTVALNIPYPDPSRHVALQWASHSLTTSRPSSPWDWCRRWTCHKCGAHTIVEQRECANLLCKHLRCAGKIVQEGKEGEGEIVVGCRIIKGNGGSGY